MTHPYPQAPAYPAQQPQQPQAYAPQQPQAYAPQQPQAYAPAPQQPQYAQPQYAQPQYAQPQYAANPYAQPAPQPQAPAGPPPSLGDFYSQPSVGWGPSVTPNNGTPAGTQVLFVVAQHITEAHVEEAEEYQKPGVIARYRNGKAKLTMKIPAFVAPGTQYWSAQGAVQQILDGRAQYYCQGGDKDLLAAAIAAAGGNPAEPPQLGALIRVTKTGSRPNRSGTQSSVKTWEYWRPGAETAAIAAQCGIAYPDLSTPKPAEALPSSAGASTTAPAGPWGWTAPPVPPAAPPAAPAPDASTPTS